MDGDQIVNSNDLRVKQIFQNKMSQLSLIAPCFCQVSYPSIYICHSLVWHEQHMLQHSSFRYAYMLNCGSLLSI